MLDDLTDKWRDSLRRSWLWLCECEWMESLSSLLVPTDWWRTDTKIDLLSLTLLNLVKRKKGGKLKRLERKISLSLFFQLSHTPLTYPSSKHPLPIPLKELGKKGESGLERELVTRRECRTTSLTLLLNEGESELHLSLFLSHPVYASMRREWMVIWQKSNHNMRVWGETTDIQTQRGIEGRVDRSNRQTTKER